MAWACPSQTTGDVNCRKDFHGLFRSLLCGVPSPAPLRYVGDRVLRAAHAGFSWFEKGACIPDSRTTRMGEMS